MSPAATVLLGKVSDCTALPLEDDERGEAARGLGLDDIDARVTPAEERREPVQPGL
jgi:hypothetical protein